MVHTFSPTDLRSLFEVFALLENGASVHLLPVHPSSQHDTFAETPPTSEPHLGLYSSGSTGAPKHSWRPWAQLKSELRLDPARSGWTWASPFSPASFAGVQVAIQAWASRGEILSLGMNWPEIWKVLAERRVHALSCTPTFLDLLLHARPSSDLQWTPAQITLGGEPLRPLVGGRFQKSFPHTRFTVVYASAELGLLLKTHRLDGWYELSSLEKRVQAWRIERDELQLLQNGHWMSTHDLVELNGDLLRILGRADSVVNVAGSKVNLEEVNRLAEEVSGVRAAFAFAEPNPVSGQIVALRFVPDNGCAAIDVQQRLEAHLRKHLRREAWPRRWEIGAPELGPNSKRAAQPPALKLQS